MTPRTHHTLTLERPLAVLDSEWTSGHPATTRLLSLSVCVLMPDATVRHHEWFMNPGVPIEASATKVHGITDADVSGKPPFSELAREILSVLNDVDIGGYSVTSDLIVIEGECRRAGHEFTIQGRRIVDAYRLWTVRQPRKLENAYETFVGPLPENAKLHDASYDTAITVDVIEKMAADDSAETLHDEAMSGLVDLARKFKRDEYDLIVFAFGEHQNKPAINHPDYLAWMLRKDFPEDTKEICRTILAKVERAGAGGARTQS